MDLPEGPLEPEEKKSLLLVSVPESRLEQSQSLEFAGRLEQILLGYPLLSTLIPSDSVTVHIDPLNILKSPWCNPWDKSRISNDSFFDLMEQAQSDYLKILSRLNRLILTPCHGANYQRQTKALLEKLGNYSYHSGLDSRIPS